MTPQVVPCGAILHVNGEPKFLQATHCCPSFTDLLRCAASSAAFLEHYKIGELLGVGGFAVVKRGMDAKHDSLSLSRCSIQLCMRALIHNLVLWCTQAKGKRHAQACWQNVSGGPRNNKSKAGR